MRVLLVGAGGREHALAWAISASPLLTALFIAPGNPGTAALGQNIPIDALDIAGLVGFAQEHAIDLVVPGPEAPLVAGLADALAVAGIRCCGPSAAAAQLEGSKAFTKEICEAASIPTAQWESFTELAPAREFLRRRGAPIVVKADGLAAGKGVVVAQTVTEAEAVLTAMMADAVLGEAGQRVVIEECLSGPEVSFFALCDGEHAIPLGMARDHKRVGDGDSGPNTGGMGAIAPPEGVSPALTEAVMAGIIRPALVEMARRGTPFRGILFAGLMLTDTGVKLIEFNVRFGDPECQALLPLLQSDLLAALLAACDGELAAFDLRWRPGVSVAVVVAARGYPAAPMVGGAITRLDRAAALPGVTVFQAGTRLADATLVAAGGRVLTMVGTATTADAARAAAYAGVAMIDYADGFCRQDIGRH